MPFDATIAMPAARPFRSLDESVAQFADPLSLVPLVLGLGVALALAWLLARHPSRPTRRDPLGDANDRTVLVLLGLAGASAVVLIAWSPFVAAFLVAVALVVRPRGRLLHPSRAPLAFVVVVVGALAGLGHWAAALVVTVVVWCCLFWMHARVGWIVRLRVRGAVDLHQATTELRSALERKGCRVLDVRIDPLRRSSRVRVFAPSSAEGVQLARELRSLFPADADVDVALVAPRA
jgi:hypothetical protein